MAEEPYKGEDRRHHSHTNSGARPFGRRLIDRISRPRTTMPPWMMGLILVALLGAAFLIF